MIRVVADNKKGRHAESLCDTGEEILDAIKYMIEEEGFKIQDFTIENYSEEKKQ